MKKTATIFGITVFAIAQSFSQSTGTVQQSGDCSINAAGSNTQLTINCSGISKAQGQKMLAILNKILMNQLDPDAVMAKLDEIQNDIRHIQRRQGWPELTEDQVRTLTSKLSAFPRQKVMIILTNPDTNKSLLAGQLRDAIQRATWDVKQGSNMCMGPPLTGIYITVRDETPAALSLVNALGEIFGKAAIAAGVNNKLIDEDIAINIYTSPKSPPTH